MFFENSYNVRKSFSVYRSSPKGSISPMLIQGYCKNLSNSAPQTIDDVDVTVFLTHGLCSSGCFEGLSSTEVEKQPMQGIDSFFRDLQILRIDLAHCMVFSSLKRMLLITAWDELQSKLLKSSLKLAKHSVSILRRALTSLTTASFILRDRKKTESSPIRCNPFYQEKQEGHLFPLS